MALVEVDGVDIIGVDYACCTKSPEKLRKEVQGKASPGQAAVDAVCERDSRIEIRPAVARYINSEHYAKSPAPGYALVCPETVTTSSMLDTMPDGQESSLTWSGGLSGAHNDLRDTPIAEQNENKGSKKF